jgi:hypothetical protein
MEVIMKALLRNRNTNMYFAGGTAWTNSVDQAFDFKQTRVAVRFVHDAKLEAEVMELILRFKNSRFSAVVQADELPCE